MVVFVFQAYGMSVLPLNLIKGTRSVAYERLENTEDIDEVEHQIENLKSKVGFTKILAQNTQLVDIAHMANYLQGLTLYTYADLAV